MSDFFDYVKNGGDEAARARAEAEYTAGHLGIALDELDELRAEIEKLRALLDRVDNSAVKASGNALDITSDYIVEAAIIDAVHAELNPDSGYVERSATRPI